VEHRSTWHVVDQLELALDGARLETPQAASALKAFLNILAAAERMHA
jgi:hypothetical protein